VAGWGGGPVGGGGRLGGVLPYPANGEGQKRDPNNREYNV
jgi:hypothetical protein